MPPQPAADPPNVARWRARLDALTRWCLSDAVLTPAAAAAAPGPRATLGDLLRRALGRSGNAVIDLLDALDTVDAPDARARLGRVLGGDVLLVVVTSRDGALVRADARACRTTDEGLALVAAFLGHPAPADVAECGVWSDGIVSGPVVERGVGSGATWPTNATDRRHQRSTGQDLTLVLPLLPLDGRVQADVPVADVDAPPAAPFTSELPTVLGGVLRPGALFLDAPATELHPEPDPVDHADGPRWPDSAVDEDAAVEDDEEDEDVVDDVAARGASLERLRARTAAVERVSAMIATDDGNAEHVGDAVPWLAEASEQELRALARGGWSGDDAIELALALAADDPEIADVVRQANRHDVSLVVEVDSGAAIAWLRRHRPAVAERLESVL